MARFQDLSTELVLGILEKVLPDDIVSISLTSKRIYQLAIPRLKEHRSLRKQYTSFKNMVKNEHDHWHDPGGLLADLLCSVMSDARVGHYVKKIDLDIWNFSTRFAWNPDAVFEKQIGTGRTRHPQNPKTNMEIIEEAVRAVEVLPSEEVDDWLHQIRRGNESPLVALLLLHTSKLQDLKFLVPYEPSESSYLLKTIQRTTMQRSKVKLYPSHLRSVEIWFTEQWGSLEFIKAFLSLPLLASMRTHSLFVDDRTYEVNSAILPQSSNVTDLSFRSGFLPEKACSDLLLGAKNLKFFTYDSRHLWGDEEHQPQLGFSTVLSTLVASAGHTLEKLHLSSQEIETSHMAPVREFRILREVELQTLRCFAVSSDQMANFISFLPSSLERLELYWYERASADGVETLTEAILCLVHESKTHLPHLRMLSLRTYCADQAEYDALCHCLGSDETAQINPKLSFDIQGPGCSSWIPAWEDNVCTCGQDCFGNGN